MINDAEINIIIKNLERMRKTYYYGQSYDSVVFYNQAISEIIEGLKSGKLLKPELLKEN